jgi:hypothetical protein
MIIKKNCENCEKITGIKNYSHVVIDTENNNVTCGVKGIIEGSSIRILNNKVICAKCDCLLYEENK